MKVASNRPLAAALSAGAATVVAIIAVMVLVGWATDTDFLKSLYGPITMKPNAAVGLLLLAAGLTSYTFGNARAALMCGAVAAVIGGATLAEHATGWDLHIDQLLFREPPGAAATASPNRPGPNASLSLLLLGMAVMSLWRGTPRAVATAQRCAVVTMVLATLALTGYLFGAVELYAVARITGIALHTAASLLVLGFAVLTARVDAGPVSLFLSDSPAGTLLRRLVVPVVVIPITLGYVVKLGRDANAYDRGFAFALFSVVVVVVLGAIVWHTGKVIAQSDEKRRGAEREREAASRVKDQFLATLSHELRTPLNVMLGWTHILEREAGAERHARAAAIVVRNGQLLARLVEDLLDVSRMSLGRIEIHPKPISLNPIVQSTLEASLPLAAERGVRLTSALTAAATDIDADGARIQQIVWNLLSNALKFTPAGGRVHVVSSAQGGDVTLTVTDTGIGFDMAFARDLFSPFRQADGSTTREHGGLGLGLSIARHIAVRHGGSLTGTSDGPGKGATFVLTLPRQGASSDDGNVLVGPAEDAAAVGR